MSMTGMWLVGAIPDREAIDLLARFSEALSEPGPMKPSAFAEALAWWTAAGDREPFFEKVPGKPGERATDAAYRLASLIDGANPETESSEAAWDACMDLLDDEGDHSVLVVTARNTSPVAALYYALEAESTSLLPGRFGNFLLSHSEITASLAHIEQALQLTGTRRTQALHRIGTWMKEMGDVPNFETEELLDGPLRVLRHAAATGCGAAAFTRWY
jgi:hypothetical protein